MTEICGLKAFPGRDEEPTDGQVSSFTIEVIGVGYHCRINSRVVGTGHGINLNLFVCKRQALCPCGDWIYLNKVRLCLWILNRAFEQNIHSGPSSVGCRRISSVFRLYSHRIKAWLRNRRNRRWKCQMWTSEVESWHLKGACRGIWEITPKLLVKTSSRQSRTEENRCERIWNGRWIL